jgi:glycerol-1-phosphate dehydrogenase [NAD(P)+]
MPSGDEMNVPTPMNSADDRVIDRALELASHTRLVRVASGVRHQTASLFRELFGQPPALIVADNNTYRAAGSDVVDSFREAGHRCLEPFVFRRTDLHAEYSHVESLEERLAGLDAIPIAVGSGTINDLTKLATHRAGRPYLSVATAASMDGYTAFGASITYHGSKQTFDCPAPTGVLADLEVIESAPDGMNSSGYADLLAKNVAGADWIVADALGVEPIDSTAWNLMQRHLLAWIDHPDQIRATDPAATRALVVGLLVSGLAMQWTRTSRVASGADHQFSHLWDMQDHVHNGVTPSHGFKVGIGTLASSALYEYLLTQPLESLDIESLASQWPDLPSVERDIHASFDRSSLITKALEETRAKYVSASKISRQLARLKDVWPDLKSRLRQHLLSREELSDRLAAAGCPTTPQHIGIATERLRKSYRQAYYIRRRFTVLDLAMRTQLLEPALNQIFANEGRWPSQDLPGPATASSQRD